MGELLEIERFKRTVGSTLFLVAVANDPRPEVGRLEGPGLTFLRIVAAHQTLEPADRFAAELAEGVFFSPSQQPAPPAVVDQGEPLGLLRGTADLVSDG